MSNTDQYIDRVVQMRDEEPHKSTLWTILDDLLNWLLMRVGA